MVAQRDNTILEERRGESGDATPKNNSATTLRYHRPAQISVKLEGSQEKRVAARGVMIASPDGAAIARDHKGADNGSTQEELLIVPLG